MDCPRKFYYSNILRMRGPANVNMVYGTAVHAALDTMFTVQVDGGGWSTIDAVLERYHTAWQTSEFAVSSAKSFPHGTREVRELGAANVARFFRRYRREQNSSSNVTGGCGDVAASHGQCTTTTADPAAVDAGAESVLVADAMMMEATPSASAKWTLSPEQKFEVSLRSRRPQQRGGGENGGNAIRLRGVWDLVCTPRVEEDGPLVGDDARSAPVPVIDSTNTVSAGTDVMPTIVEFKSTLRADPSRPRNWHVPHQLQLRIYGFAYLKWQNAMLADINNDDDDANMMMNTSADDGARKVRNHRVPAVRVVLKAVESGEEHVEVFSLTDDFVDETEAQIVDLHERMERSEFEATPSYQVSPFEVAPRANTRQHFVVVDALSFSPRGVSAVCAHGHTAAWSISMCFAVVCCIRWLICVHPIHPLHPLHPIHSIHPIRQSFQSNPIRSTPMQGCAFCPFSHVCSDADDHATRYNGRVGGDASGLLPGYAAVQ